MEHCQRPLWQHVGLAVLVVLMSSGVVSQNWRSKVCTRQECRYVQRRVCAYATWQGCCRYKTVRQPQVYTVSFCCQGWRHAGDYNCNIPICSPGCMNGGTCVAPGKCTCPVEQRGERCEGSVCSHASPCYPGTCIPPNNCQCASGFRNTPGGVEARCLQIDNSQLKPFIYQMQATLAHWITLNDVFMEKYSLLSDSSQRQDTDFIWSNRRDFNLITVMAASQFSPSDLPPAPDYVGNSSFGITSAFGVFQLAKLNIPGNITSGRRLTLNDAVNCSRPLSGTTFSGIYNCTIRHNFDLRIDTGDILTITFHTTGGGTRTLLNLNSGRRVHRRDAFVGVNNQTAVEFRFDVQTPPKHPCLQQAGCAGRSDVSMLQTQDITKNPLTMRWNGWVDEESGMFRYALEVFKLSATAGDELEIRDPLSPLFITEVMETGQQGQRYEKQYLPPNPGMYAVILEASDLANNSRYVRRLVLYDNISSVSSDPDNPFHAPAASPAVNFTYQNISSRVTVSWSRHFLNKLHEDQKLLGRVRSYPPQLEDFRKAIPNDTQQEDHEGSRTVAAIANSRGIVKFDLAYKKDNAGGLSQPKQPEQRQWQNVGLQEEFTFPEDPKNGDTLTVWVRAYDLLGNTHTERVQVTIDNTPPDVKKVEFQMNQPVPAIDFSSTFSLIAEDRESGIAYVTWTFTRSNGSVIYKQRVPGKQLQACNDVRCYTTSRGQVYQTDQSFSLSNCHMMVEKENLATEEITVSIDVTNGAGLVHNQIIQKRNLTVLNGTEAYYPPQNIRIVQLTDTSATLTWDFPPGCFARSEILVMYLQYAREVQRKVHKDARQLDLSALSPDQAYDVRLVTVYGQQRSDPRRFTFRTRHTPIFGAAFVGIVIGIILLLLLLILLIVFVLWRKGLAFQGAAAQRRISRLRNTFRRTKLKKAGFQNLSVKSARDAEELYLDASQAWGTRPAWQIDADRMTLLNQIAEGKFAIIYKATLGSADKTQTVAAKVLKSTFSEEDSRKMLNKINFHATEVGRHDNVLAMVGAVLDNSHLGPVMVLEYCEMGQMDAWLAKLEGKANEETIEKLFRFSRDIACGMKYLASKNLVHERLAARNVLLTFFLDAKVAGFGPKQASDGCKVPVKWAAPEVLEEKIATEKSDVWSFGITIWEIFSLGEPPYPDIRATEIGTRLKSGYRMGKPEFADDMFYNIMMDCWAAFPEERPGFRAISDKLSDIFQPRQRKSDDLYYLTNQPK